MAPTASLTRAGIDRPVRAETASRSCRLSSVSELCLRSMMQGYIRQSGEGSIQWAAIGAGRLPPMAAPPNVPEVPDIGGVLGRIVASHRVAAARRPSSEPLGCLMERAQRSPPPRPFVAALRGTARPAVIAEIKRRSPSRGAIDADLDPAVVARSYADGGAACLSVLTDGAFFGGSPQDLALAREAVGIPVLRKDFTVCEADVCDARIMGADAVLLIVAALSDAQLARLSALADELGLAALVEVHNLGELERAMTTGPTLVGINQRDLVTFEIHRRRALELASKLPDQVVKVAESGVEDAAAAARLAEAGFDAVLVGEALLRAADRAAAVRHLREAGAAHAHGAKAAGSSCS